MSANLNGIGSKFLNRMFRKIDGLVWDLTTGKQGIQDAEGIHTFQHIPAVATTSTGANKVEGSPAHGQITVNPFETFGVSVPAFATQVALPLVKEGDIIVGDKAILGWVISKTGASLKLMNKTGTTSNYTPPKVSIMGGAAGGEGVLVVQNLLNTAGGEAGFGNLQGSLIPLLMMSGGDLDLDGILPMMLLSQSQTPGAAGAASMNAMLPMLAMSGALGKGKDGGSSIDKLLPLMLMGGGLGGAGGMNPMMLMMLSEGGFSGVKTTQASGEAPALKEIGKRTAPPLQRLS